MNWLADIRCWFGHHDPAPQITLRVHEGQDDEMDPDEYLHVDVCKRCLKVHGYVKIYCAFGTYTRPLRGDDELAFVAKVQAEVDALTGRLKLEKFEKRPKEEGSG